MKTILQSIIGVIGHAVRVMVLTHVLIDICLGLLIAGLCYYIAADASAARGIVAAVVGLGMCVALGFFLGFEYAAAAAVSRAIQQASIGSRVLNSLLERISGNAGLPGGQQEYAAAEFEEKLNNAADALLSTEAADASERGLAATMAARGQRMIVWAVVRLVLAKCGTRRDGQRVISVDLVRTTLVQKVDSMIADSIRRKVRWLSCGLMVGVIILAALAAYGIRVLQF